MAFQCGSWRRLRSGTLELIDRMGCVDAFVEAGMKATAANIVAGDEHIARITLEGVASPFPYALMLSQSETERLMEEHLASLGVRVERRVEVTGFEANEDGVVSTLHFADGREETQESAWLVGCDGAHSAVRLFWMGLLCAGQHDAGLGLICNAAGDFRVG